MNKFKKFIAQYIYTFDNNLNLYLIKRQKCFFHCNLYIIPERRNYFLLLIRAAVLIVLAFYSYIEKEEAH